MVVILGVGINALIFHTTIYKQVETWNNAQVAPLGARIYGTFSIVLWLGIITLGRWFSFHSVVGGRGSAGVPPAICSAHTATTVKNAGETPAYI